MPKRKMRSIRPSRWRAYESIKKNVGSKSIAAAIANKGATKAGRRAMAKKAARTKKRRRGR